MDGKRVYKFRRLSELLRPLKGWPYVMEIAGNSKKLTQLYNPDADDEMKPISIFQSDFSIKERNLHLFPRTFIFLPTPRKLPSKSA